MAGEELIIATARGKPKDVRLLESVAFMGGIYLAFDAMSTINSSPWTHETFSSPEKMKSGKEYVLQAIGISLLLGTFATIKGGDPWPLIGVSVADAYLGWLYWRAFGRANIDKSQGY